jgi:ketosteroid isomerase-like protein
MSQENVEIVRAFYDAWERQDIEFILANCDPDIVIVQPSEVPDAKTYLGHTGVRAAFEDWPKQWESFRVKLVRLIDIDEERLISVNRQMLSARGIDFDQEVAFLHTQRDGKAIRVDMFLTAEQALKAAGLSE